MDEYSLSNLDAEALAPTAPAGTGRIDLDEGIAILRELGDLFGGGGSAPPASEPTSGGMTPAQQIALYERIGWPPPGEARLRPLLEAAAAGGRVVTVTGRAPTTIAGSRPPSVPAVSSAPAGATGEIDGTVMLAVGGLVLVGLVVGGAVLIWTLA